MLDDRLLPECYGDTLLVRFLGFSRANHQFNIREVAKTMQSNRKYKTGLAVGLVDNDKQKPKYFGKFTLAEQKDQMCLLKHPEKDHYLVYLDPGLEKWLMYCAEVAEIDPEKYGFKDYKALSARIKHRFIWHGDNNVKRFLNNLEQLNPSPFETLRTWLKNILQP